jgi:signal peptidase I
LNEVKPEEIPIEAAPSPHGIERHGIERPVTNGERVSLAHTFGARSFFREVLETICLTAIIFLALNTTTGRFQVRGSSMEPTLHNGQYLVISKVTYWIHPPERGDVIVFHPPNSLDDDYIKRVIGLPGELVEIRQGALFVDGVQLDESYIINPGVYSGAWQLEGDEYFVLGDNRRNSSDSHTWGVLPKENIVGKAWLGYWPPEEWGVVRHHVFSQPGD